MHQTVVFLCRGTLTSWRNVRRGMSWSSTKENGKSCAWEGITPWTRTGWGLTGWKATLQRKIWVSWWTGKWTEVSKVHLWQRRPTAAWAALGRALPAVGGWWCCISTWHWWGTSGALSPVQGSPVQQSHGHAGVESSKGPQRWLRYWISFITGEAAGAGLV